MRAHAGEWQHEVSPGRASVADAVRRTQAARWAARIWSLLSPVLVNVWTRIEARRTTQRHRSLRVLETVGMGEKRFVAIVQVQDARFLIGGGSAGVSLLARLDRKQEFAAVFDQEVPPGAASSADHIGEAW